MHDDITETEQMSNKIQRGHRCCPIGWSPKAGPWVRRREINYEIQGPSGVEPEDCRKRNRGVLADCTNCSDLYNSSQNFGQVSELKARTRWNYL